MEASPAAHGPNPPICASGLLEGPQCGLSHAEKTHRRPSAAGNSCPLPSQAFWKLPPLPSLRGPQTRSSAIRGGGTWWWWVGAMPGRFIDSTSVVSTHPQNDPESLHFSLFKDSTPTPSPPLGCWSVFPLVLANNYSGIEALGGMVGRGPLCGPRGSQSAPCPSPWQPLSPWTMSTGK